jgi:NodT family efflux transporter outer membrane factor (OMF) lipoprotein
MMRNPRVAIPSSAVKRILIISYLAILALFSLTSGCATKPPPDRETVQKEALPNAAISGRWKAGNSQSNPVEDNWLALFNDPQLDALVIEAIMNNPDLRVAAARVEQAAGYVELSRAALRPSLNVLGTGGLKFGGGSSPSDALQGIFLFASWEPDLWGRLRYGRNAAQESYASAQADFEFALQSIAATTAKSWFTATETLLQRNIEDEMVRAAQEFVDLTEKRLDIGAGSEQDVALARSNLGNFKDKRQQVILAHGQALRALEILLGRYPSAELQARKDLPKLSGPIPVGIPLQILERRPDIIAAERRVAAAFNRVGEAKAAQLPRIKLNASGGALDSEVVELKDDFQNPTGGVGASLVAPIYRGGELRTQVRIRTAEQRQAVAEYARSALRAISDVENALAAEQALVEREKLLEQVVVDNQRVLEMEKTSYRLGRGDMRSVQQQQVGVHTAQLTLLNVRSERLSQRVNLHLALGGSFQKQAVVLLNPEKKSEESKS